MSTSAELGDTIRFAAGTGRIAMHNPRLDTFGIDTDDDNDDDLVRIRTGEVLEVLSKSPATVEVDGSTLINALAARGIDVSTFYVGQTGGGTATILGGPLVKDDAGDESEAVMIGPGSFDWSNPGASTFDYGDLYAGPGWSDEFDSVIVVNEDSLDDVAVRITAILTEAATRAS